MNLRESVAIQLHESFCNSEHMEGCSWYYELSSRYPGGTWNGWAHKRWLEKATNFINRLQDLEVSVDKAMLVLSAYRES